MIVEAAPHVRMLLNELKSPLKIKEGKGKEVKEGGQCSFRYTYETEIHHASANILLLVATIARKKW